MDAIDAAVSGLVKSIKRSNQLAHTSIVIAVSAILENQLERALKKALRPLSRKIYDRMFNSFGPLSNFSSKILMSYALGVVPLPLYEELERIRDIRNKFAHSSGMLHLQSPEIEPKFLLLKLPPMPRKSPVETFLASAKIIDEHLDAYLATKERA